MAVLWEGRFSKPVNELVNEFNASIHFDKRLYKQDIQGSLAHSAMLEKQGIISAEDAAAIQSGLKQIQKDIEEGKIDLDAGGYEDIHMAVEQILTERIGQAGKRLHTGRSRNDQVALDMRLYAREELEQIHALLKYLLEALVSIAKENQEAIMPGYTHLQRAQPVTFAHVLMAYASMFKRDLLRIESTLEIMDECPLGSGALAGTSYPLDRAMTAQALGFSAPCANSLDGVSDRDYLLQALSDLSILMMHLSRLSEEVVLWSSWEFKYIELDDAYATGSSIMPQKKNPDICELIRGKTGRVYGDLMQLLTVMKSLPLAYNKDMQEDKESFFDACDTVKICIQVLIPMLETMTVLPDNMLKNAKGGFINATDLADYLTRKGLPFRDAYKITGGIVGYAAKEGLWLEQIPLETLQQFCDQIDEDIYESLDLKTCVKVRQSEGGPSIEQTTRQIEKMEAFLAKYE